MQANDKILFIDDEPDVLHRLGDIFNKSHSCFFAGSASAGLEAFNKVKPSLVVCDVNLPDMSGYDLCLELKISNPSLSLVLLSAYNDKYSRVRGLEVFANTYIDKSLSDEEIYLRIRNLHPCGSMPSYHDESKDPETLEEKVYQVFSELYARKTNQNGSIKKVASLSEVARLLSISPRSLQRRLKDEAGCSFTELHLQYRLGEAKKYLEQGYSANETSSILGFSSPSHFSSSFKKSFGLTPSAYLFKHRCNL